MENLRNVIETKSHKCTRFTFNETIPSIFGGGRALKDMIATTFNHFNQL